MWFKWYLGECLVIDTTLKYQDNHDCGHQLIFYFDLI